MFQLSNVDKVAAKSTESLGTLVKNYVDAKLELLKK